VKKSPSENGELDVDVRCWHRGDKDAGSKVTESSEPSIAFSGGSRKILFDGLS
jgi:hypothetical protein